MATGKICPNCDNLFKKLKKGGHCPNCDIRLKLVTAKEGQFNVGRYVINQVIKPEPVVDYDPNLVISNASITIKKVGEKHWSILYKALPQNGVCPNCKQVLFKRPRFLKGNIDMKCNRCKHMIDVEFNVYQRMTPTKS